MAAPEHLTVIRQGVPAWNAWRNERPSVLPSLRKADLSGQNLAGANLNDTNLRRADLSGANLDRATLRRADLRRAKFVGTTLRGADFTSATLVECDLRNALLDDCLVYGISAWNLKLDGASQRRLVVSRSSEPTLAVDNLLVAQFVHFLVRNRGIREVIETVSQRLVLILGRFSPQRRKDVLDAIGDALRELGYLPVIFDFERPTDRDFTETVRVLAGLSLFVVVDLTDPQSSPLELQAMVPEFRVPFVPIIEEGERPFSMFGDLTTAHDWMLKPVIEYSDPTRLIEALDSLVVQPALRMRAELTKRKAMAVGVKTVTELLREQAPGPSRASKDAASTTD